MKRIQLVFLAFFTNSVCLMAQVGIGTETPTSTLDVAGNVLVQGKLYLEDPGSYVGEANSNLLVIKDNTSVVKYDVSGSSYGPINYAQFIIRNVSNQGLRTGFNTKISAANYTLAVHGFYFLRSSDDNTNISFRKTEGSPTTDQTRYIEGQQFYAFVQDGTWWLRAFVNNSQFHLGDALATPAIYMDVIIYRNNFITKIFQDTQTVNMRQLTTAIVPLPTGF